MSRMLTLIHAGWASARSLARSGRRSDALTQTERLLSYPDLPAPVAADAHRLAGELLIDAERFVNARRHLRAAAALEPNHARTHYLLGVAFEKDPHGDDSRAMRRFRKASRLEPKNPLYRACHGRSAVRNDRVKAGVRAMVQAANDCPESLPVVRVAVGGLIEAGRVSAARRVLTKARFRHPGNRELAGLWERTRFEAARLQQYTSKTQDAEFATEGDVSTLPFVRLVTSDRGPGCGTGCGTIRLDLVSKSRPHLARLRVRKADR